MKVLLIIIICIAALMLIPVGVNVIYDEDGVSLRAIAGLIRIRLFPREKKPSALISYQKDQKRRKKEEKKKLKAEQRKNSEAAKKEEKKKRAEKKKKSGAESSEDRKEPEGKKKKKGGTLKLLKELVPVGIGAVRQFVRSLRVRNMQLYLSLGAKQEDPASAADLYGKASAAAGNLTQMLEQVFRVKQRDIRLGVNFVENTTTVYLQLEVVIRIGSIFWIGIKYGIKALFAFCRGRKAAKNG